MYHPSNSPATMPTFHGPQYAPPQLIAPLTSNRMASSWHGAGHPSGFGSAGFAFPHPQLFPAAEHSLNASHGEYLPKQYSSGSGPAGGLFPGPSATPAMSAAGLETTPNGPRPLRVVLKYPDEQQHWYVTPQALGSEFRSHHPCRIPHEWEHGRRIWQLTCLPKPFHMKEKGIVCFYVECQIISSSEHGM